MNDISALRSHLFNTLQALQDKNNPMDVERAKAVCEVGQVIINSAKAEIDFARVNGSVDTVFFTKVTPKVISQQDFNESKAQEKQPDPQVELSEKPKSNITDFTFQTKHGLATVKDGVTTHRMK